MARYCIVHKDSSWVATDDYSSLEDAIEASANKPKHRDKVLKIYEDKSFGGYVGYYCNGEELSGYSF